MDPDKLTPQPLPSCLSGFDVRKWFKLFYFSWMQWYFGEKWFNKLEKVDENYFAKGLNSRQRNLLKLIIHIVDGNCRFSISQWQEFFKLPCEILSWVTDTHIFLRLRTSQFYFCWNLIWRAVLILIWCSSPKVSTFWHRGL